MYVPTRECASEEQLLALWGLSAAARGVGAGAAVGLDVRAGSLVLLSFSVIASLAYRTRYLQTCRLSELCG